MPSSDAGADDEARRVGRCVDCRHAVVTTTGRGSRFWRCRRAETDPRFARYPRLPVVACPGHEPARG